MTMDYALLELSPDADDAAVQRAYRRLARRYHPDVNGDPAAEARMRAINEAYAVLSDRARRAAFETLRSAAGPASGPGRRAPAPSGLGPRLAGLVLLAASGWLVLLTLGLSYASFGVGGLTGQPTLRRAVVEYTPTAQAIATRVAAAPRPQQPIAPSLRDHPQLHAFPGQVLVPPRDLAPFAELAVGSASASGSVGCPTAPALCLARYSIEYGSWERGGARLSGAFGRWLFDDAGPKSPACAAGGGYCTETAAGRQDQPPGAEHFRDLAVAGAPAVVSHRVCCSGPYWSATWYDRRADVSYRLELSQSVAQPFGIWLTPDNRRAAEHLVEIAAQLERLP